MDGKNVKCGASLKEDAVLIAIDGGGWTLREFRGRGSMPEVDAIISRVVEEFESVFEAVVVYCVGGRVRLG